MDSGNPVAAFIGLWMFLKVAGFIGLLAGGLFALYCLSRTASNLERIASALERQNAQQNYQPDQTQYTSPVVSPYSPVAVPEVSPAPPIPPA